MKRKLALVLILALFPLIAVFGCNEKPATYFVSVSTNSISEGRVNQINETPYTEGTTLTLTATSNQKSDGTSTNFITWLFQDETIIENGEQYSIKNETKVFGEEERIVSSVLTFKVNKNTQGHYTAIFEDGKMNYIKFDSLFLTTDTENPPTIDDGSKIPFKVASFEILQSNDLKLAFSTYDTNVKDNVLLTPEKVSEVLKLDTRTSQKLRINARIDNTTRTFDAEILFRPDEYVDNNPSSAYTHNVQYDSATQTYLVSFDFSIGSENLRLGINFKNLGANSTLEA